MFSNPSDFPYKGRQQSQKNEKNSFGCKGTPGGQFMHLTKLLFLLPIDHDEALAQAIQEATAMNPDMTVEKIEIHQTTQADSL